MKIDRYLSNNAGNYPDTAEAEKARAPLNLSKGKRKTSIRIDKLVPYLPYTSTSSASGKGRSKFIGRMLVINPSFRRKLESIDLGAPKISGLEYELIRDLFRLVVNRQTGVSDACMINPHPLFTQKNEVCIRIGFKSKHMVCLKIGLPRDTIDDSQ